MFRLSSLLVLVVLASCAHVQPDPHFWPGSSGLMRRVPVTKFTNVPPAPRPTGRTPSFAASSWQLVKKHTFGQRVYRLTLRDDQGELIDSAVVPDILVDGETRLSGVKRVSPGVWDVVLEFTADQSIANVGFVIGDQRVERFRQIHFQIHDVDILASRAEAHKLRVRADGTDELKVSVEIRDSSGYNIFSFGDFDLRLVTSLPGVVVSGPFSGHQGPYFKLTSRVSGPLDFKVTLDGEVIAGGGRVEFVSIDSRRPAQTGGCLEGLAVLAERRVPAQLSLVDAYTELVTQALRRYEEKGDTSAQVFERFYSAFSSESCTEQRILDTAREEAGRSLRNVQRRLNR